MLLTFLLYTFPAYRSVTHHFNTTNIAKNITTATVDLACSIESRMDQVCCSIRTETIIAQKLLTFPTCNKPNTSVYIFHKICTMWMLVSAYMYLYLCVHATYT